MFVAVLKDQNLRKVFCFDNTTTGSKQAGLESEFKSQ